MELQQIASHPAECLGESGLFSACPAALVICRKSDGRFLEANPAMIELLERDLHAIIGQTDLQLSFWASEPLKSRGLSALAENLPSRNVEARIQSRSGKIRT